MSDRILNLLDLSTQEETNSLETCLYLSRWRLKSLVMRVRQKHCELHSCPRQKSNPRRQEFPIIMLTITVNAIGNTGFSSTSFRRVFYTEYSCFILKGKVAVFNEGSSYEDVGQRGGIAPRISNLDAEWRRVLCQTVWRTYSGGRSCCTLINEWVPEPVRTN